MTERDIMRFERYFDVIDMSPANWPARFAFFLPNEEAFSRWSGYPSAARPESGRVAGGKGMTPLSCRESGLGEALELACASFWGDEPVVRASIAELGTSAVVPAALLGYSDPQIAERRSWNGSLFGRADWRPARPDPSRVLDWVRSRDEISGEERFLPADFVYIGRASVDDEAAVAVANNSGCGLGATQDAAKLHALLELIERDATGLWWYRAHSSPAVDTEALSAAPRLHEFIVSRDRRTKLFDISAGLPGVVVAAVSCDPDGKTVALGFAAGCVLPEAALRATVELLQMEIALGDRIETGDPLAQIWVSAVNDATPPLSFAVEPRSRPAVNCGDVDLTSVVRALGEAGCEVCFVDLTREEIGLPVFRAVIPGLCSDRPRLGASRLLAAGGAASGRVPILV